MPKNFFIKPFNQILKYSSCIICNHQVNLPFFLCKTCLKMLTKAPAHCPKCFSLKHTTPLPNCAKTFNATYALYGYNDYIRQWLLELKFNQQLFYAKLLGTLLGHYLKKKYFNHPLPEVILPVPLHPSRLKLRGFNQSYLIARSLQNFLSLKIDNRIITKTQNAPPQSSLSLKMRHINPKNSFMVHPNPYKYVAVVDDVYTTGATLKAIGEKLRRTGVQSIDLWCVARSLYVT